MHVTLLAHTQLNDAFLAAFDWFTHLDYTDGQAVGLTAIRTCYSSDRPSEILTLEGDKYFGDGGKEGERLFNHIVNSGHTSTLEHISFTFAIESVSRALLAQLTRHRVGFSYSVQSQRYVKFGSDDKSKGFDYVVPKSVKEIGKTDVFVECMCQIQAMYNKLRRLGIPAEDARSLLPNAATCNLVMTVNLRSLLDFYSKRGEETHAQAEIKELAEQLKEKAIEVEPWIKPFFERS